MRNSVSGVGVIDKAVSLLDVVEAGPATLAQLIDATGMSRATAHRLATALELHGMLRRDELGRFLLGWRLVALGRASSDALPLAAAALPALESLRNLTGESVQLYVRDGEERVCLVSLESPHGLRTIVRTGAALPLRLGSGGKALLADGPGWVESVAEREPGVASVSAPVLAGGAPIASVSVSGPIERLTESPGQRHGHSVVAAADEVAQTQR